MAIPWVIVGIPFTIGLWYLMSWWTLIPVAVVAWATIDYVRFGGSGVDQLYRGFFKQGTSNEA